MPEPSALTTELTEFISRQAPGSRMHGIGTALLRTHGTNQDRRAAVLRHPDLAKRLTSALHLANPGHWTGFIPPAFINLGESELCQSRSIGPRGGQRVRYNQLGHRTEGEQPNTAPERKVLLEISAEAWHREHNPPITEDNPELSNLRCRNYSSTVPS